MTDPTVQALEEQVAALQQELRSQQRLASNRTWTTVALATVFCVAILSMVAVDYSHFRSEWTRENLQAGLQKELEELAPTARYELDQLGAELMPVFAAEGRRQLPERWPEMGDLLAREAETLRDNMVVHAQRTMSDTNRQVRDEVHDKVFEFYPGLRDDRQRAEMEAMFAANAESAVATAMGDFYGRFDGRLTETRHALAAFDSHREGEAVDLHKRFIQLWLHLLEEEIMGL